MPSWYSGLSVGLTGRLDVIQRKCARFALEAGPRSHIGGTEFGVLKWLPFPKRVLYFTLVHTYKIRNGLSPDYLAANFTRVNSVHLYNTRQCNANFSLARTRSPLGTFNRSAITGWNSLPDELKKIRSLKSKI